MDLVLKDMNLAGSNPVLRLERESWIIDEYLESEIEDEAYE